MSKLLDIQPKELRFTVELKKQSTCSIRLSNVTSYYVAFKVKTTSPKRYCVRPNVGIVMPNSACDFTVMMQMPRTGELECKDKFLIQSTIVSAETTDEDITASMFVKDSGNYVEEKKLKVILIGPIESPPLSPINGSLGHGLGRETSFFSDQIVNGVENPSKQHMVMEDREEPELVNIKESKVVEEKKVKPVKSVLFKLDTDLKESKPVKEPEELEPPKYIEEQKTDKIVEELYPAITVEEVNPINGVEEVHIAKTVEGSKPAKDVGDLKPVKDTEKLKPVKDSEKLKPVKIEEDLNRSMDMGMHAIPGVLKPEKEFKNAKDTEELKLVKDVEEIKSKISEFELKLSKAEFTISKLMVERNSNIEERKILQEKLAELSKRGVKNVQVGFPLLFVCLVALASVVLGYRLHA